jgi:subtilisin family serine protease
VRRVWEQKGATASPPDSFSYGAEYRDSASILAKAYDVTETTHGTHVGGIAGGSGFNGVGQNHEKFRGMAYKSDLIFVAIYPTAAYWLNTGMADMLDGINYTFQYAASVNRPAVANLSWGCPLGPRDGSSLFSRACDQITGPGKIFVVSGGNNGANRIHFKKTFTNTDTLAHTFTTFSSSLSPKVNQLDFWGDSGKAFKVRFSLYNSNTQIAVSKWIYLDNLTHSISLKGLNGDTCFITATAVLTEFNGKPHVLVQVLNRVADRVGISISAKEGTVNVWQGIVVKTSGYYGNFTRYSYPWAVDGDVNSTCGDLVSTRSALAVGAYNSKVFFINVLGLTLSYSGYIRGRIASFSSLGPTADGRTKPDIAGPGLALASSVSSYDPDNQSGGAGYSDVVHEFVSAKNGRTYPFAMAGGTSMSAPAVSGIVAMLLQVNPTLSPTQLMDLLAQTSIRDANTGVIPVQGSNTWGFGKINAYKAIKTLLEPAGIIHLENTSSILVFPNPSTGQFSMEYIGDQNEDLKVALLDPLGRIVHEQLWKVAEGSNIQNLDFRNGNSGFYFVRISGRRGVSLVKVIVN